MSEDEVIRKRLTIEGDSGNDDKRIMSLVKTFLRWAQSNSLTAEEVDATYQKMLFTLGRLVDFRWEGRWSGSPIISYFFIYGGGGGKNMGVTLLFLQRGGEGKSKGVT